MAGKKFFKRSETQVTPPATAEMPVLQYRQLDAAAIADEIARRAPSLGRALRSYERAKAVSQETLDAPICV